MRKFIIIFSLVLIACQYLWNNKQAVRESKPQAANESLLSFYSSELGLDKMDIGQIDISTY